MTMNRTAVWIAAVLLAPTLAFAQSGSAATPLRDRQIAQIKEIERGFHVGVAGGVHLVLNPPAAANTPRPFSTGQMVRVEMGLDVGDRFSVDLFALGAANRAGADYVGFSDRAASGDFSTFVPG